MALPGEEKLHEDVIKLILQQVSPPNAKDLEGCNDVILKQVERRLRKEIIKLDKAKKSHLEIILELKTQYTAIFQSERVLYETGQVLPEQGGIELGYSDSDNDDDGGKAKIKKEEETNDDDKQTTTTSTTTTPSLPVTDVKLDVVKSVDSANETLKEYYDRLAKFQQDEELLEQIRGLEMRGKVFPISNDGSCPKCKYKDNVFVVLDFLFPSQGEMPEILQYLLSKKKAVSWSEKQDQAKCKDPPMFLCNGRCPRDCKKNGFNINWQKTDLVKIYLFPETNYKEEKRAVEKILKEKDLFEKKDETSNIPDDEETQKIDDLFTKDSEFLPDEAKGDDDYDDDTSDVDSDEYDEGHVDITYYRSRVSWVVLDDFVEDTDEIPTNEDQIVRTMLALEDARVDYIYGEMKTIDPNREVPVVELDPVEKKVEKPITTIPSLYSRLPETVYTKGHKTTAGSAALDILKKQNPRQIKQQTPKPVIKQSVPPPSTQQTPTHILKGAQIYGSSSVKTQKPAFTANDFPISRNGACPYCHSWDVVYIILMTKDNESDDHLPELLRRLIKDSKAKKMKKGEYDLPSFQCRSCTYGFNLDWEKNDLNKLFYTPRVTKTSKSTTISKASSSSYVNTAKTTTTTTSKAGSSVATSQSNYQYQNQRNPWMNYYNTGYMPPVYPPFNMFPWMPFPPFAPGFPPSSYGNMMQNQYQWNNPAMMQQYMNNYPGAYSQTTVAGTVASKPTVSKPTSTSASVSVTSTSNVKSNSTISSGSTGDEVPTKTSETPITTSDTPSTTSDAPTTTSDTVVTSETQEVPEEKIVTNNDKPVLDDSKPPGVTEVDSEQGLKSSTVSDISKEERTSIESQVENSQTNPSQDESSKRKIDNDPASSEVKKLKIELVVDENIPSADVGSPFTDSLLNLVAESPSQTTSEKLKVDESHLPNASLSDEKTSEQLERLETIFVKEDKESIDNGSLMDIDLPEVQDTVLGVDSKKEVSPKKKVLATAYL